MPTPPPEQAKAITPGIKAAASKKAEDSQANKGITALTIPLSTGTNNQRSGLSIPI